MVQLRLAPITTKNLFSRDYVEDRLKSTPVWRELKGHEEAYAKIKKLYEEEKDLLKGYNEYQLQEHFINKVLKYLGHIFEVQQKTDRGLKTPDYAFFLNETDRREALRQKDRQGFYTNVLAVGDAKQWELPLDKKTYEMVNPSFQIDYYLRETDTKWGILTNGRYWRLYYRETSYRLDSYFEVDLASILEEGSRSLTHFKYFYLFFRKEAFVKDESGKNFLEKVYEESLIYAKKLGDSLERSVYQALKVMVQGFLKYPQNKLEPREENIKIIHDNALIFLYRLLFILYADSRGMLKIPKKGFEDYDITKIKVQAFNKKQRGSLSEYSTSLWDRLSNLFQLINSGSEALGIPKEELYVPPYNGGLFHDEEHPFLSKYKVGDKYLAEVLEYLTMTEENDTKIFIDYSNLEIRHLGSIYEGLLEYKLKVASEDMVAIKKNGKEVWIPETLAEGKKIIDRAKKGDVYLITDKGERKATGSYYTPDYIVKYIVENTLGPVVEEKIKDTITNEERINKILSIKVLDPAMGSGHFLVEATDFLAKSLVPYIDPEMQVELKENQLNEIEWARREVIRRCIYGVDLNPLATELAKLSLWLSTMGSDRPLSFLDHHLKHGNSLIGADIRKLDRHPKEVKESTAQSSFTDFMDETLQEKMKVLLEMHRWIMDKEEETLQDIKEKEQKYDVLVKLPFRKMLVDLADIHTSYYLGNKYSKEEYYEILEVFREDPDAWATKVRNTDIYKKAKKLAREKHFFHWMLEFPDIFLSENPGFDAVIGNPPWGADFDNYTKEYLNSNYESGISSNKDSYGVFTELAIRLTANNKLCSYITPDTFLRKDDLISLRNYIFDTVSVNEFLESGPLFDKVRDTWCLVFNFLKRRPSEEHIILHKQISRFVVSVEERLELFGRKEWARESTVKQTYWMNRPNKIVGYLSSTREQQIIKKIEKLSNRLGQLSNKFSISRGEEGSKKKIQLEKDSDFWVVFPEHIERFSISDGVPAAKDKLTQTKLKKYYTHPKIWIIRIQKLRWKQRIVASFDERPYSAGMKTLQLIISPNDNISDLKFLCSILCSKLINYWCTDYLVDDMNQSYLEKLPIRRINFITPEYERSKLVAGLKQLYNNSNFSEILTLVDSYLPKDEEGNFITEKEKSDVVHDFLAFLAEQMIELNKKKNAEIKGFLEWLEGDTGVKVEDMTLKTKIKEYYKYNWEEFKKALMRNKKKITSYDISRREPQERIKAEFDASIEKLKPLIENIQKTDSLIDQVVYKLYGLTEEEIRVVEESG
ncbi:Eco57I restriction-modification methylase domain-containing protein [Candidatus Pyrohabitans sp.]